MKKKIILNFAKDKVQEKITYNLIKKFDIEINILRADINTHNAGVLLLELEANKNQLDAGISYLKNIGVEITYLFDTLIFNEKECISCGSCTGVCFSEALSIDNDERKLDFNPEKCVACGLCLTACPLGLLEFEFGV